MFISPLSVQLFGSVNLIFFSPFCLLFPSREATPASPPHRPQNGLLHGYSDWGTPAVQAGVRPPNAFWCLLVQNFRICRLIAACSAVKARWKSTGKGKFQMIIAFLQGTRLLASQRAQTFWGGGRVPMSLMDWSPWIHVLSMTLHSARILVHTRPILVI